MSRCYLPLIRCCWVSLILLFSGCLAAGPPAATFRGSPEHSPPNPDGTVLAQARAAGSDSLILLTSETGLSVASLTLPGQVAWLAWHPGGDLLVVTTTLKHFSFGANYQLQLHRWDGQAQPLSRTLTDTTLKPLTLAIWGEQLSAVAKPTLSPQGDVLAFLKLHDPPAFDPYLKVAVLHLEAPGELLLGSQAMPGADLKFSADGEVLSWLIFKGETFQVQPWLGGTDRIETEGQGTEAVVDPVLLGLRSLRVQGLIGPEDYRNQWQKRRQP